MKFFSVLLLLATSALAADPAPSVKAELTPAEDVWVGQQITLALTIATPDLFAGVPSFEMPAIPGTVILPPDDSPTVGSEEVGDDTFTTQRHEFAIYAQRAGMVRIPAFTIRFETNAGFGKPTVSRTVTTEEVMFTAKTPPGAERLGTVIAARDLTVTDVWKPEPKSLKVGSAFTRTVTVTAPDVPGMVFPPFQLDPPAGLAAYPKEPSVSDQTERGTLAGTRADAITFVCEQAGPITIPDRTLTWFDLETNELKTVNLPGRTFEVAPDPATAPTPAPTEQSATRTTRSLWGDIPIVGIIGLLGWLLVALGQPWLRRRRTAANESEAAYFARFRQTCKTADPLAVYRALLQWLDHFGPMTPDQFAHQANDPELTRQFTSLRNAAFDRMASEPQTTDWRPLYQHVTAARQKLGQTTRTHSAKSALPPLNPIG